MTPLPDDPTRPDGQPSPEEIRQLCREIRATWSPEEERARRRLEPGDFDLGPLMPLQPSL